MVCHKSRTHTLRNTVHARILYFHKCLSMCPCPQKIKVISYPALEVEIVALFSVRWTGILHEITPNRNAQLPSSPHISTSYIFTEPLESNIRIWQLRRFTMSISVVLWESEKQLCGTVDDSQRLADHFGSDINIRSTEWITVTFCT